MIGRGRWRGGCVLTPLLGLLLAVALACASGPPQEHGEFRTPELVELTLLDPALTLDIRYATADNFVGRPVYTEARAFLQRPAAEALARARRRLEPQGYGLRIFDGYRPWSVTKVFWDATPADKKAFVADPKQGSRHNRGCAVDLTLFDLATGREVEMPSPYDDFSERAHPDFTGGSPEARAHRDLLRAAMEAEGFTVYEHEWWHFDYRDWRSYPIQNLAFAEIRPAD
ncbi:MAG: M15 family metallopeptidase [Thermoanaerobaculia bacterium]|nr:M15 family metallopeptidase [Thermoanaerobaculia bacterium]MBP9825021.1 M15 family metallopeptidase [Thermoanaerobaculia bacterium]